VEGYEIRLAAKTVSLPWEKRTEIERRLEARAATGDGYAAHAVESLHAGRVLTLGDKLQLYTAINEWLARTAVDQVGAEVMSLREELQRDLGVRLF
jgi:hypothetical protein